MAARERLASRIIKGGSYFAAPKEHILFAGSGCAILDCVVGGGWPLGRVTNIVGDKSTGKTLLAIEACANFARAYPEGKIRYREVEAAFDKAYAQALGMPLERVDFGAKDDVFDTVEDIFEELDAVLDKEPDEPSLYILDSLDALSDRDEMERAIDKGTFGAGKAKQMSQLFRRVIRKIEASKVNLMIISQVRDNIGVTFGAKYSRSGGKALDFYASQVVLLAHIERIKKTIQGNERVIGVRIKAKCEKNKISLPFRECEFEIIFGYGIDDLVASLEWLKDVNRLKELGDWYTNYVGPDGKLKKLLDAIESQEKLEYRATVAEIGSVVSRVWQEIETGFLPSRQKYL